MPLRRRAGGNIAAAMADKDRDAALREMARHRGLRLVKSRRRKPGGDYGRYGLADQATGEQCFGFGANGLEASADEVEDYLRGRTASTWKKSLAAAGGKAGKAGKAKPKPPPPESAKRKAPPSPELRIRDADSGDSEAIAALLPDEFGASAGEVADRLAHLRRAGELPLVAKLGGDVVGVITWHVTPVLHRPAPVGRITFLQVDEGSQRKGIGRALVEAAEARLAKHGCKLIEVTSNVKLTQAHKFYRALGFERTSFRFAKPTGSPPPKRR